MIILDGLIGYPVTITIDQLAQRLRGFNSVVLVQGGSTASEAHLQAQLTFMRQPYATATLGGAFLRHACQTWGASYTTWGRVLSGPLRMWNGAETVVRLPGEYILYESGQTGIHLAALGQAMRDRLLSRGLLPAEHNHPAELRNALREWVIQQFGSLEHFQEIYGTPLTDEFWLAPETLRSTVLPGIDHPLTTLPSSGYVAILTERAMIVWSAERGVAMVPLGQAYLFELQQAFD